MKRLSLYFCFAVALCMTAIVTAAPSVSPVADASMKGDREAVRTLLQQGADVNAPHADGMSALHWAAERGDGELAGMLLYAGANVGAVTRIGHYTPLHLASRSASAAVVDALLKAGADVNAKTTTSGVTPLHLAAEAGSAAVVTKLLDKGADANATESEWGQTPLMFAAAQNRADAIKVLLARGADAKITSKFIDLAKQGQLDRAAADRQRRVLEAARSEGKAPTPSQVQAAVQAAREVWVTGKIPPPDPAAADGGGRGGRGGAGGRGGGRGAGGQADPLNEDGPVSISTKGGLTALLHAARQGYTESVAALLDGGAPIDQPSAGDQTTPLLMAAINGQWDTAMLLIKRGANPNLAAAGNSATPLWATINTQWQPRTRFPQPQQMELQKATYLDVMEALLKAGADPNARLRIHPWYMVYSGCGNRNCGLADTAGSTAFWRAAYGTDVDAMRLLAKYGADPNIATMAPNNRGGFGGGGRGGFGGRGGQPQGGAPGADGTGQPASGAPDPMPRVSAGSETFVSPLPPIPPGGPGVYPLHAAAGVEYGEGFAGNAHRHAPDGWLPAVKYLVEELGVDVNARDNDGYTALHHAAARGDNAMILYLVSKGADVTVLSRRGQSTADMANGPVQRVSPFPETVKLLESLGAKNNHRCVSC